jgi:predicted ester cyclase
MSVEENKAAFRRIPEEVINSGNLDLADEVFAPDYVDHAPVPPGVPGGLEGFKAFFTMLRAAFPDLHYTVENVLAEGEMVAGPLTVRGTHQGEFMGIAPTGIEVTWTETHVARFENGKLVEHWGNSDDLGMMQQIGAVPSLGRLGARFG